MQIITNTNNFNLFEYVSKKNLYKILNIVNNFIFIFVYLLYVKIVLQIL